MSWLARSIANTLKLDDNDDRDTDQFETNKNSNAEKAENNNLIDSSSSSPTTPGRGVREDISELTKTLSRQFWGVASFLAPPPSAEPHHPLQNHDSNARELSGPVQASDPDVSDAIGVTGIRSDFAEIGGKFKSGISKLSSNIAVSEFTKMASSFLQLGTDDDDFDSVRGAVGVTEEVVAFAMDIAMHPETWLDFPLPQNEDDEDFDLSDAQQEHALAVERLAPRLSALRIELCPGYMSENCFWKIYFVLVHPRLSSQDAELLSTPQIVEARPLLTQDLWNNNKANLEKEGSSGAPLHSEETTNPQYEKSLSVPYNSNAECLPLHSSTIETATPSIPTDVESEKHPVESTEIQIIDKSVIEEVPLNQYKDQNILSSSSRKDLEGKDEDDVDDWLKEETSGIVGATCTTIPIENDEDVSFSDLEEDDGDIPTSYKKVTYCSDSSTKDSRDWVQLGRSSTDSSKDINPIAVENAGCQQASAHNSEMKESSDWLDVDDIDVA